MLTGNVLFTAPGREPLELSTAEAVEVEAADPASTNGVNTALLVGLVVTVAGVGIAGLVWAVARRRRRVSSGR